LVLRAGELDLEHPLVCTPHLLKRRSSGTQFNLASPMQMHQSDGNEPHVPCKGEKLLSCPVCVGMSRFLEITSATFHGLFRCFTLDARGLVRPASGAEARGRHMAAKATSTSVLVGSENHSHRHSKGKKGGGG
jgi:hypothetical protein